MIAENKLQNDGYDDLELMTASGLARRLKVSLRQVRYLKAQGLLPESIMVGRSERWCSSEVTKWIEARCPSREQWEQQRDAKLAPTVEAS